MKTMRIVKAVVIGGLPRSIGDEVEVSDDDVARCGESCFSDKLAPTGDDVTPEQINEFNAEFEQMVNDEQDKLVVVGVVASFKNGEDSATIASRFSPDRIAEAAKMMEISADMEKLTDAENAVAEVNEIRNKAIVGTFFESTAVDLEGDGAGGDGTDGTEGGDKKDVTETNSIIDDIKSGAALATLKVRYNKDDFIAAATGLELDATGTVDEIYARISAKVSA